MPSVHLADRGVVRVSGDDAKTFLDNLVTCDLDRVSAHIARLGALLTPQGKILFDFLVFQAPPRSAEAIISTSSGFSHRTSPSASASTSCGPR